MRKFVSISTNQQGEVYGLDNEGFIWRRVKDPKHFASAPASMIPMIWQKIEPPEEFVEEKKEVKKNG